MIDERPAGEMDNPYYEWSPIVGRAPLRWPEHAPVALCVIVSLEALEWFPPAGSFIPPSAGRYGPYPQAFQTSGISSYEYGNRVGVFRVMEVLDRYGIKATVAMDAQLACSHPFLVAQCRERDWEFIGHGLAFSRMITAEMDENEERAHIAATLEIVEQASGRRPSGWLGADYGESAHTVAWLAEMGVRYVCDWVNDEQPYRMTVPAGRMVALPVSAELDDVLVHWIRKVPIGRWARAVVESHQRLARDGASTGRLLVLNLHPFLIGQPFRIGHLDDALGTIMASNSVWTATGEEIVDWYLDQTAPEPSAS